MSDTSDMLKQRIEEATGVLTGDDKLRNKGKTDQAIGRTKKVSVNVVDKLAKLIHE